MQREHGFSLIELMVALVMTLIVSGAIYGLMSSGQGAFRREPALIDRQQNIRVAMDLIVHDLENAGAGMSGSIAPSNTNPNPGPPPLSQIFTTGLNNAGPVVSAIFAGQNSDMLEFFTADGSCPGFEICNPPSTSANIFLAGVAPANGCLGRNVNDSFFAYVSGPNPNPPSRSNAAAAGALFPNAPGIMFLSFQGNVNSACTTGLDGGAFVRASYTAPAGPGINSLTACAPVGVPPLNPCASLVRVNLVRYEIAGEIPTQPASYGPPTNPLPLNPPCLWRSEYGRRNRDGTPNLGPGSLPLGGINPWEMVARGIDDLQVDYQAGGFPLVPFNQPPGSGPLLNPPAVPLVPVNTDSVIRRVRITLSARAVMPNEPGGSRYATNNVPAAEPGRRGQLTTIVTPRAALATLAVESDQNRNWR